MADKILTELVINRGTKQKFDDLPTKSPDELYFITDGDYFATKTDLNAKQDTISDLATIRSNASSAKSTVDTHVANGTIHVTAGDKIAWSNKQNKLVAGENITIDESTNTISATGGETIKNQNADSEITKTYDWVGTLQEAQDQNVRALHPDWKIYITDDVAGGSDTIYTKTEVDTGFVAKGHEVIAFQVPTAANDYTWYRKYADGWVEQGGTVVVNSASVAADTYSTKGITFPIPLKATRLWKCQAKHDRFNAGFSNDTVTTGATVYQVNDSSGSFANPFVIWEVKGMAA